MTASIQNLNEPERAASALRPMPRSTPLVLVVDDHEDTRFLLSTVLGTHGLNVLEAIDGVEAIDIAERALPDLILMDGTLPRLDGLAALRRIREHPALRGVPVLVLSGHAQPSYRAAAFAAGCDDFLVKPIDLDQLKTALEKHLGAGISERREAIGVR